MTEPRPRKKLRSHCRKTDNKRREPEYWDHDLEFFLLGMAATHGERSNFSDGGRGGGGTPNTCPFTDEQLGKWVGGAEGEPERHRITGEIERARRVVANWVVLSVADQELLCQHYQSQSKLPVQLPYCHEKFGTLAQVALFLTKPDKRKELVEACAMESATFKGVKKPEQAASNKQKIEGANKRAYDAIVAAHDRFREIRAKAAIKRGQP